MLMTAGSALASAAQAGWRFVKALSTAYVVYHYGAFVSQVGACVWAMHNLAAAAAAAEEEPGA